jgi:hypothetical protein
MGYRFTLVERLGSDVFRAVKRVPKGMRSEYVLRRLAREPADPKRLLVEHHNLVETLDVMKASDGAYFVVSEYVECCNLAAVRPSVELAIYIAIECCRGLDQGLVHGALTARSILLTPRGGVKIAGVGVAGGEPRDDVAAVERIFRPLFGPDVVADGRFDTVTEVGDALAQHLFERKLAVRSRDLAAIVVPTPRGPTDPNGAVVELTSLVREEVVVGGG